MGPRQGEATLAWSDEKSALELVVEPVMNDPSAPTSGAMAGYASPVARAAPSATVRTMPLRLTLLPAMVLLASAVTMTCVPVAVHQ